MKDSLKIKISDIAQKAHVSTGTVDRVLHNRGEVAQATRVKVLKIIDELKYSPNIMARSLASKKRNVVAILLPEVTELTAYWEFPRKGINKVLAEFAFLGIETQPFYFNYFDINSFIEKYNELLKNGPFIAVIVAPIFTAETTKFLTECKKINLPYTIIDSQIKGSQPIAYIGQNTVQSGWVAGRLMSYAMHDIRDILIVIISNIGSNSLHFKYRIEGFKSFFANFNNLKSARIQEVVINIPDEEQIFKKLDEFLTSKIQGVFIPNSRAYKVADYIEKKEIKGLNVVGYDLLEKNIAHMRKSNIEFLISQRPEEQGYRALVSIINNVLMKKSVEPEQFMPIDIITRENIDFYNL